MLRKFREWNLLVTFISHENVTSRLDDRIQSAKRSHFGAVAQNLVTKGSASLAAVPVNSWRSRVLDEIIITFENLQVIPDSKLHGGSRFFAAHGTMAPTRQSGLSRHLSFKGAAHARPVSSRHDVFPSVMLLYLLL